MLCSCAPDTVDTTAGRNVYTAHCASCHREDGSGFRQLYPPLVGSPYLGGEIDNLPCLIKNGITGAIVTGDGSHNKRMPGFPELPAEEVTELVHYLQIRWGQQSELVAADTVARLLESCP